MSVSRDQLLFEKSLGFFGAIVASASHEMNNVLAIISELSGLLDDLFVATEEGLTPDLAKQRKVLGRIPAQVARGTDCAQNLNRFAHSIDNPHGELNVEDNLEQIVSLCQRLAVLRKMDLNSSFSDKPVELQGSSFDLQHVIFRCIELALASSKQGSTIDVGIAPKEDGASIVVTGGYLEDEAANFSRRVEFLAQLVDKTGGSLEETLSAGQLVKLVVALPSSLKRTEEVEVKGG